MVIYAGQGDSRRSMELLWRGGRPEADHRRSAPGPKPGLTVDMIVAAAIEVADTEGMAALSMRAVGERLGRTGMSLYTYVPNKSELVDLMYDQAHAELAADFDPDAGWRIAATSWAERLWRLCIRHPWVLRVSPARPVLGPYEFANLEALAGILHQTRLSPPVVRGVIGALSNFVRGAAATIAETRQAAAVTGRSDEDWWYDRAGQLMEIVPDFPHRFPMLVWAESEKTTDPDDADTPYLEKEATETFSVGLDILLDGVEAAMKRDRRTRKVGSNSKR